MAYFKIPVKFDPGTVMYLIILDKAMKKYGDIIKIQPTDRFFSMVRELVLSYAVEGTEPPAQVATAVMNVSDDMMAGRDVSLRAGDYVDLMNYARKNKIL
jgi:hypothetical protein